MNKLFLALAGCLAITSFLFSETTQATASPFQAFTGKVTATKVRVRAQPHLDGVIVREANTDDLFLIKGEKNGYYEVSYPKDLPAYIFRTFVLDGTVEGTNVNVRLKPNLESPVIAQLNTGDKVKGTIVPDHSKWLQIPPPSSASLFIATDYVERIGDASVITSLEKRKAEVEKRFQSALLISQSELRKSFPDIALPTIQKEFQHIKENYSDFPSYVEKAKEALELAQDAYLQKKVAFLEDKIQTHSTLASSTTTSSSKQTNTSYAKKFDDLTEKSVPNREQANSTLTAKMTVWEPLEQDIFSQNREHENQSIEDFYAKERLKTERVDGILEAYTRPIKSKPGDYILRDKESRMPIGYLYSTQINLEEFVGQHVTLRVAPRPNQHFAFPAFFVHSTE